MALKKLSGRFDYLIVGDASGQRPDAAVGWACFVYDNGLRLLRVCSGAASSEGLNDAELVPYLHAVLAIREDLALAGASHEGLRVAIITDHVGIARIGRARRPSAIAGRTATGLWEAFRGAARGMNVLWESRPGGALDCQRAVDKLASRRRRSVLDDLSAA